MTVSYFDTLLENKSGLRILFGVGLSICWYIIFSVSDTDKVIRNYFMWDTIFDDI